MEGKVFVITISLILGVHYGESSSFERSTTYTCQDGDSDPPVDVSTKTLVADLPRDSLIACGRSCHHHDACAHLQYDDKLGVCFMYSNVTSSQQVEHSQAVTCSVKTSTMKDCSTDKVDGVFLRRIDGSVDFYRNYTEYQKGFGDEGCEFWLGLDRLHQITSSGQYKLLINLTDWSGERKWAVYNTFTVGTEADGYRLTVGGLDPSSIAGDNMALNNGQRFSARDRDQDADPNRHCARRRQGGWWYNSCARSNPTGLYKPADYIGYKGIFWQRAYNDHRSFKTVVLSLKLMNN